VALDPIIPGGSWTVDLDYSSGDAYIPADHRALLVIDSPVTPLGGVRITKEYLSGGGGDTGTSAVGTAVRFTLSPTDTAACDGHPGLWKVYVFVGDAGSQYPLVPAVTGAVVVDVPPKGVVPHG